MTMRSVTVASAVGLHARPAAIFSRAAASQGVVVTIVASDGRSANAASILGLLSLGIPHGAEVNLRAEGEGADDAVAHLAGLLETELDTD